MSMKQISFLKFNDIYMSFDFVKHMSLDKISNFFFNFDWNTRAVKIDRFLMNIFLNKSRWNFFQFELHVNIMKYINLSYLRIKINAFCFLNFIYLKSSTWLKDKMMIFLSISINSVFSLKRFMISKYKSTRNCC